MLNLRRFYAGSPRYVRSQILLDGASETNQAKAVIAVMKASKKEFIQVAVGCKHLFAFSKLKASVSMGAAGAFCYFAL